MPSLSHERTTASKDWLDKRFWGDGLVPTASPAPAPPRPVGEPRQVSSNGDQQRGLEGRLFGTFGPALPAKIEGQQSLMWYATRRDVVAGLQSKLESQPNGVKVYSRVYSPSRRRPVRAGSVVIRPTGTGTGQNETA